MASHIGTSSSNQSGNIHILDITVRLNARRQLQSVTMLINDYERDVTWRKRGKDTLTAAFEPSLNISTSEQLELRIQSSLFRIGSSSISDKDEPVHIPANELMQGHLNQQGHLEWRRTYEKVEITIRLSQNTTSQPSGSNPPSANVASSSGSGLTPTTDDIAVLCPRFRILVAGRTGVGKSSLINGAFGVHDALVSHDRVGKADINREIFSSQNQRFVLHDSQGFEPGEISNPGTVRGFIAARNNMPNLKDKLHAIWICIAIPVAGGRVFETGLEDLFRLKNEGQLGNTPIIAVFTKFDELVIREDRKLNSPEYDDLSEEDLGKLAHSNANKAFESECLRVFQTTVGMQIPYKAVSTKQGYESTLSDLIQITFDNVKEHVAREASIVTAIAQKVNPSVKIDGSIDVGKRRYWAGLASSINFPGKTLEACLGVIHTDIINVWNLEDPNLNLHSKQFKSLMSHLVSENVELDKAASPHQGLTAGLAMLGTLAGIVSALAGPAAPIVIPIAGCLVMAKWMYDVYNASRNTLEHIMAYIVDLTLVMQNIFWISEGKYPVSRRLIKLAFKAYLESETKGTVHRMIAHHVREAKTFAPGSRDVTLDKIIEIIDLYRIESAEMWTLKGKIPPFNALGSDEPWELRKSTK